MGSLVGSMTFPAYVSSTRCEVPPIEQPLGLIRQLLFAVKFHVHPWHQGGSPARSVSFVAHRLFSWVRTLTAFSPLTTCTAPSDTLSACSRRGGFRTGPAQTPPSPVSKVCGVFNSRILPSILRQPKSTFKALRTKSMEILSSL